MRRIVLDLQSAMFTEAISQSLRQSDPDFLLRCAATPSETAALCKNANVLIMEVVGYSPWTLEQRMKLRDTVRRSVPECKIVLLVDEKADAALADAVRQAKKDKLIDNFIYASVSPTYLSAVIDTL